MATSEAEQALAESWKKLIELRLKSQKLQLRQRADPMSPGDMQRVEVHHIHKPCSALPISCRHTHFLL